MNNKIFNVKLLIIISVIGIFFLMTVFYFIVKEIKRKFETFKIKEETHFFILPNKTSNTTNTNTNKDKYIRKNAPILFDNKNTKTTKKTNLNSQNASSEGELEVYLESGSQIKKIGEIGDYLKIEIEKR